MSSKTEDMISYEDDYGSLADDVLGETVMMVVRMKEIHSQLLHHSVRVIPTMRMSHPIIHLLI